MSGKLAGPAPIVPGLHYVRPLGSGGFADILLYEQDFPRRSVAVKVMHANVSDTEHAQLFQREADALARVSAHPSILTIHGASVSADGRPYLVLEYCPGSVGASYRTKVITVKEALDIGVSMAAALETCHRNGILHRDIKPSNLLVNSFGTTVLADFGIVGSAVGGEDNHFGLSIPWSSPEVVSGASSGSIQTEVWSLCATIYALLAGRSPFESPGVGQNTDELLSKRIQEANYVPLTRPDVPPALEQILAQGLAKDPAARQRSAAQVGQQLQHVQQAMNLPVTELEVAAATGFTPPPLGSAAPTTVRSQVPIDSKRLRAREQREANRAGRPLPGVPGQPELRPASSKRKRLTLIIVGVAAVIAVAVAVGIALGGGL